MGSAADRYAAARDAAAEQRSRLALDGQGDRWDRHASRFRQDPHREFDASLSAIAAHLEADDTLLDVGGGAGRFSLPLALRCREVINVEPSPAMREQFEAAAKDAGIENWRLVAGGWPEASAGLSADVALVANVTYFVRDIVPFVEALNRCTRRRVIVSVWSVPPPNQSARLFELVHGEPQALAPGHRELLPVLWELGLLPEVRVVPGGFTGFGAAPRTRDDAIRLALETVDAQGRPGAAERVEAHFDELFTVDDEGVYRQQWREPAQELHISWETG